jgi:peptide/nickel transport system substrate-binding protein
MNQKRFGLVLLVLFLTAFMLFAEGNKESKKKVEPSKGVATEGLDMASQIKYWATLDLYTQETSKSISKFSESPLLAEKVKKGELLPLEKRLPVDVLVVKPKDEIGKFGGTLNTTATSPNGGGAETWPSNRQYMFKRIFPNMGTDIQPNIPKGYKWSNDYKTLTIYLREGMKWSDGEPFTSKDFIFWWEDVINNKDLTPIVPIDWRPGGESMKVTAIDDYTVQYDFVLPYPAILDRLTVGENPFKPMHYMKQFHPKYNPDAIKNAKVAGYETWYQYFMAMDARGWGEQQQLNTELPEVNCWVLDSIDTTGNKYYVRNAYYWKVDTAGQQLPYMDYQVRHLMEGPAAIDMKAIVGELTMSTHFLSMENMPLYKGGEEKGNYNTFVTHSGRGSRLGLGFNQTHQDSVKRNIYSDLKFREAMSLAINRKDLNDVFFYGKAVINQYAANPETSFWEEWMQTYMTDYDPEGARTRLDAIGMDKFDSNGFRLGPDGKTFIINIEYLEMDGPRGKMLEIIKENWEDVGIKVSIKELAQDLYETKLNANELDLTVWVIEYASEVGMRVTNMSVFRPVLVWRTWLDSDGKLGEEPPEEMKELDAWVDEWMLTPPTDPKYMELGKKIVTRATKSLNLIGTIGFVPAPMILKKNVVNGPDESMIWAAEYRFWVPYQPEQWFYK